MRQKSAFTIIVILAVIVRLYGLNWDQNQHLHPDERFLTMVTNAIKWPSSLSEYLDSESSPLNPHNAGFPFFVYGTFPLFLVKWVAESLGLGDYNNLTLVGRLLSAVFDAGTVILVYFISQNLRARKEIQNLLDAPDKNFPLLAAFFYAVSVLPIQLSHFFAVDTFLTFFIVLSFYILIKIIQLKIHNSKFIILNSLLGVSFGLAIASKISALLFLPIIGSGFLYGLVITIRKSQFRLLGYWVIGLFIFVFFSYLTLRLSQPYLFKDSSILSFTLNPKVVDNWKQLRSLDRPDSGFPPGVQWITTKAYIFPLKNMLLWGMGLPLGILAAGGLILVLSITLIDLINLISNQIPNPNNQKNKKLDLEIRNFGWMLLILWILLFFTYQGTQFTKTMRYFHPIYPFLTILVALFTVHFVELVKKSFPKLGLLGYLVIGLFVLLWPLAFLSIYSRSHTRIQASDWIYENIPANSTLSVEHWDDGLPLSFPNRSNRPYQHVEFPLYHPDNEAKWLEMAEKLEKVDYIILSSNRLYGSIMTVPEKYPVTNRYYQDLFDGSLGFVKVAEFTSRPNIPLPFVKLCITPPGARYGIVAKQTQECPLSGISFVDDYADENYTVFDHPKVIIFKKIQQIDHLPWRI